MRKNNNNNQKLETLSFPNRLKKGIFGLLFFLLAIIIVFSFFGAAGVVGEGLMRIFSFLIGKTIFLLPLIFILTGFVFLTTRYQKFLLWTLAAILISISGFSGILSSFHSFERGGILGQGLSSFFKNYFGFWISQIIFLFLIISGAIIFWYLLAPPRSLLEEREEKHQLEREGEKPLIARMFKKIVQTKPKFKIKEIEPSLAETQKEKSPPVASLKLKTKPIETTETLTYLKPPFDLLESDKDHPSAGDTRANATIIKKTLQNFGILVEMSEINIGPTVTQYTLKPAEGIKLSKITGLTNDLALALAAHPIRIEAPIPGRALVGIEVPNKVRAQVRLRNLIENPAFQKSLFNLAFVLGRDVVGNPCYADLARMPHLLVAGSTGTGKTIFLNNLILSLLYRHSPEILRFILIDPKRVEFSIYNEIPHLLTPVIFDAQRTVNVLKWLILEMERRFDILSRNGSRDIFSYNEKALKAKESPLPYIILIIDELADLMAVRGREIEAGIVRLAQMARAVAIHLVVATQRPSVEVITGLIKANITSRISFQVASQVDSRTILDMAGAEKLLGRGDMLYLSAETGKPKRVQTPYVSEKEVKKVINWLKTNVQFSDLTSVRIEEGVEIPLEKVLRNGLSEDLEKILTTGKEKEFESFHDDPLYSEAKKIVIEAKKASASLLQRKLKIGYARAARLIDMLEERGVVGPGEGAKPREVYIKTVQEKEEDVDWQKI